MEGALFPLEKGVVYHEPMDVLVKNVGDESGSMVELREISKWYARGVLHRRATHAVRGLSLKIRTGEVFGLLGPNGAGKTTTVKMICGLIRPTSGDVRLGADRQTPRQAQRRQLIGAVLEGNRNVYWNLTAWENLLYYARLRGLSRRDVAPRGRALLDLFELSAKRTSLAGTLSRGMQQKLAVCCALIAEPPILLVDEPTLGLDVTSARAIESVLGDLVEKDGRSVLLTTHNMKLAESLCHRIGIIRNGELLRVGTVREFRELFGRPLCHIECAGSLSPETRTRLARQPGTTVEAGDDTVRISVDLSAGHEATACVYAALRTLEEAGARLLSLRREEPSLEDVFVRMTGAGGS